MAVTATQLEVDSIALFIEACSELEREPFFGKDEKLSYEDHGERKIFVLSDRCHFRSALISFRRIWMKSEPSFWSNVVAILQRPGIPDSIARFAAYHGKQIESIVGQEEQMFQIKVPAQRIIELWLNTVFAHGGIRGQNKRSDFEAIVDKCGHAFFEFAFRNLVKMIGNEWLYISNQAAKPALELFSKELSLQPSFRMGAAFGIKRRETTKEGHIIIRQGSSEYFSEETFEERFKRILGRDHFYNMASILKHLDRTQSELLRAILKSKSFAECLDIIECHLEVSPEELGNGHSKEGFTGFCTVTFPGLNYSWVHYSRDGTVLTSQIGSQILDSLLAQFRAEFIYE